MCWRYALIVLTLSEAPFDGWFSASSYYASKVGYGLNLSTSISSYSTYMRCRYSLRAVVSYGTDRFTL